MRDVSDLQLLSSFNTHAAQIPRRAVKICFLPLLLLVHGVALEGMQASHAGGEARESSAAFW